MYFFSRPTISSLNLLDPFVYLSLLTDTRSSHLHKWNKFMTLNNHVRSMHTLSRLNVAVAMLKKKFLKITMQLVRIFFSTYKYQWNIIESRFYSYIYNSNIIIIIHQQHHLYLYNHQHHLRQSLWLTFASYHQRNKIYSLPMTTKKS